MGLRRLPEFACPDLSRIGLSWVHPISKPMANSPTEQQLNRLQMASALPRRTSGRVRCCNHDNTEKKAVNILGDSKAFVRTTYGTVSRRMLKPGSAYSYNNLLPSDMGSRIGMMFVPNPLNPTEEAELHFIVNGRDQGPCEKRIPYKDQDLYAVIDVYGTTKEVRIIQVYLSNCMYSFDNARHNLQDNSKTKQ